MRHSPVTFWRKIGYSSGNLGKNLVFASLDYFLLFYLTEIWGMPPAMAGLVILIALLWDGIADPVMGVLVDRFTTPFGRYGPYLLIGAPVCAAAFGGVFAAPPVGNSALFAWTLATTLVFRTAYTICDVPHNALMARIAPDPESATFVSGARFIFSSIGGLLIGAAAIEIFALPEAVAQADKFGAYSLIAALIFVTTIWIAWLSTRNVDHGGVNSGANVSILSGLKTVAGNPSLLWLLATAFVQAITIPSFAKCFAYFGAYQLNDPQWSGTAVIVVTLAQLVSVPAWVIIAHRATRIQLLTLSLVVCAFAAVVFLIGHESSAYRLMSLLVFGGGVGGLNVMIWALLPEAIARGEDQAERVAGLPTGLFLLSLKAGSGVGAAILGVLFQHFGVNDARDAAGSSPSTIGIMSFLPVIGAAACCLTSHALARSLRRLPSKTVESGAT